MQSWLQSPFQGCIYLIIDLFPCSFLFIFLQCLKIPLKNWGSMLLHAVPTCRENKASKVTVPASFQFARIYLEERTYFFTPFWFFAPCYPLVKCLCELLSASTALVELFELWKQILSSTNGFPVVFLTWFSLTIYLCKSVWGMPTGKPLLIC